MVEWSRHNGGHGRHGGAAHRREADYGYGEARGEVLRLCKDKADTRGKKRERDMARRSSGHGGPRAAVMAPAEGKMADSALTLDDDGN
jgi:hypothetical protein